MAENYEYENPDLIVHGSYKNRAITAVREYHSNPPLRTDCVADFVDFDLGDRRGWGSTPEEALDDLLEQCSEAE